MGHLHEGEKYAPEEPHSRWGGDGLGPYYTLPVSDTPGRWLLLQMCSAHSLSFTILRNLRLGQAHVEGPFMHYVEVSGSST